MTLHTHKVRMKNIQTLLKNAAIQEPLYEHAYEVLIYMEEHAENFTHNLWLESPFFVEFSNYLQQEEWSEADCFPIMECLIIFCREKQLRNCSHFIACTALQQLLNAYEQSPHWSDDDNTIFHKWYWYELPKICKQ